MIADSNGDGRIDLVATDTNADGEVDQILVDTNYDGVADQASYLDQFSDPYLSR
jgi:hypothetical protein